MILSVLCTHPYTHTHTQNLVADGGRRHTCTHHTLTVSFLLTQTHFEPVQTDGAHTCTRSPGTPPPHFSPQAGPSVPRGRETERQRKRSVDPVMCVLFTPQLPVLSLSLSLCLHLPFPQFQAANSAVCQLHSQSCEITYKHSFHLYLLQSPS